MAKIKDPVQFSRHFRVAEQQLSSLGVLDPTLNVDTKLFIDPLLLGKSSHPEFKKAEKTYKEYSKQLSSCLPRLKAKMTSPGVLHIRDSNLGRYRGPALGMERLRYMEARSGRNWPPRSLRQQKKLLISASLTLICLSCFPCWKKELAPI